MKYLYSSSCLISFRIFRIFLGVFRPIRAKKSQIRSNVLKFLTDFGQALHVPAVCGCSPSAWVDVTQEVQQFVRSLAIMLKCLPQVPRR